MFDQRIAMRPAVEAGRERQVCHRMSEALESGAVPWGSFVTLHWHYTMNLEREALYVGRPDDCLLEK